MNLGIAYRELTPPFGLPPVTVPSLTTVQPTTIPASVITPKKRPTELQTKTTWASVATRNAPAKLMTPTSRPTISHDKNPKVSLSQASSSRTDNWLFIRLNPEHYPRTLHPYHIKNHLNTAIDGAQLASIHIVPSRLALKPTTEKDAAIL